MNIGNNLTLESLQDTYYAKNNSNSFNIGVGIGTSGNTGSASIGFSTSKSTTDSAWVNDQTEIIGSNSVNISVGTKAGSEGKTDIIGAIIASGSYDEEGNFTDNGNLELATKELEYSNINDFYTEESTGFGFSTTVGKANTSQGKSAIAPEGQTKISMTDTGSEKEQTTFATIGNGSITIVGNEVNEENNNTDLIDGLNRDVNNSQEITKDMITGALDSTVTIDNRLLMGFVETEVKDKNGNTVYTTDENGNKVPLTTNGYDSIVSDIENFGSNLVKATVGVANTLTNPLVTAYEVLTDDNIGVTETVDQWKANAKSGVNIISTDRDIINNLSEGQKIAEIQAATGNQVKVYGNGNDTVYGFYDENGKQIYINAASGATINTETFVNTYGHETGHIYTKNEAITSNSGNYASSIYALSNFLSGDSVNTTGTSTVGSWMVDQLSDKTSAGMLIGNTISANTVNKNDRDERTIFVHGTWSDSSTFTQEFKDSIAQVLNDKNQEDFKWSGDNTDGARVSAALQLLMQINEPYDYAEGETLNLVGHSHGGNVIKILTDIYDSDEKIDNILLLATPPLTKYSINQNSLSEGAKINTINDTFDAVQTELAKTDTDKPFTKNKMGSINLEGANNINTHQDRKWELKDYVDAMSSNNQNIVARDLLYYHSNIKSVDTINQIKDQLKIKYGK